jgi:hypothetical protein
MRGSLLDWLLAAAGLLGMLGWATMDFQPSTGLKAVGCLSAIAMAVWSLKAYPAPKETYSPLQGARPLRSRRVPVWLTFPGALLMGWAATVYGAGLGLGAALGTDHIRQGVVAYSTDGSDRHVRRGLWPRERLRCTKIVVELQTARGPRTISHCDRYLGGAVLPAGFPVTYRTRESVFGLFVQLAFRVPYP